MSINSQTDLNGLREAGRIVCAALNAMERRVRPGVTTMELNEIGADILERRGARSAPMIVYDFPAEVCISVNEEVVHGIPSARIVEAGDLVKLDVTAEKDGYMADAALTVAVNPVSMEKRKLVECARQAFHAAMVVVRIGNLVNDIGRVVERVVRRCGFSVIPELSGHGIGRTIHEGPEVLNYLDPRVRQRLSAGLVITVEPMIAMGSGKVATADDGWTIKTVDGSLAAHYEQTIVVTAGQPIILTAMT